MTFVYFLQVGQVTANRKEESSCGRYPRRRTKIGKEEKHNLFENSDWHW